jgi:FkbM family methyltransferase
MLRDLLISVARLVPRSAKTYIHHHRALDRLSRQLFSSVLRTQGDVIAIESGPLQGLLLKVSEHVSHAHIQGDYEIETQLAIDRLVQPGSVCYDLGASIGYLSLLMARKAARVYAFEPAPHAAAEIALHAAANRFENIVVVANPASDGETTVDFALSDVAYGSAIMRTKTRWRTIQVKTITLDAFARSHEAPDFIKIDVEGEEGRVLEGARLVLGTHRPLICCELHSQAAAEAVCRVLAECNYHITTLEGETFRIPDPIVPGMLQIIGRPN